MGYYTNFWLQIENEDELDPSIPVKVARELNDMYFDYKGIDFNKMRDPLDIVSWESEKWYEHRDDMLLVSTHFPECKFVLEGEGEKSGDMWREYYYNGHLQVARARIEYDDPIWDELYEENFEEILNGKKF